MPVLAQLLEPSPPIASRLAPQLHESFTTQGRPKTYAELIDRAAALVKKWDIETQAEFLASHPRIGETIGLSALSGQEQGPSDGKGTPGEVLKRLSVSRRRKGPSSHTNNAESAPRGGRCASPAVQDER